MLASIYTGAFLTGAQLFFQLHLLRCTYSVIKIPTIIPQHAILSIFILTVTLLVANIGVMKERDLQFTLDELCALVEMNKRKVRYYIQKGLVDRPIGLAKGAFYTHRHVEQLLAIRKWKDAGLSLERIQELLGGELQEEGAPGRVVPPPRPKKVGAIEVWSHLHIADGIEVQIEPQRSGLSPEQVRALCRMIMHAYEQVQQGEE